MAIPAFYHCNFQIRFRGPDCRLSASKACVCVVALITHTHFPFYLPQETFFRLTASKYSVVLLFFFSLKKRVQEDPKKN